MSADRRLRIGRIPYVNCYPVYGGIDRGVVALDGDVVDGVPTALNAMMADGALDVSVVSAVEYARDWQRYVLLPDLAISCDGPVRSVLLFTDRRAEDLDGAELLVSRSSMTSVHLLRLLFQHVWNANPVFVPGDSETSDLEHVELDRYPARLVIGDAALVLRARVHARADTRFRHVYDLGVEWKRWTGLPFVFAVWVAQRRASTASALAAHAALIQSRDWGLAHIGELATQASVATGIGVGDCAEYLSGLDYGLSLPHVRGLTEFFRRLADAGAVAPSELQFLTADHG
jgi:chorismate dehydratase